MIRPYIANPNAIILAISKGTDDLANSEALKLAREHDIQGTRTIGVITQIDLQDYEHEQTINDVMNRTYPLKLGINLFIAKILKHRNWLRICWSCDEGIKSIKNKINLRIGLRRSQIL